MNTARDRILGRVRSALIPRDRAPHPGPLATTQPSHDANDRGEGVAEFTERLEAAGGEVVRLADVREAGAWLEKLVLDFAGVAIGATVPEQLRPSARPASAEEADLAVSVAVAGVAETGSLILDARDGRRVQLLAPNHVVFVEARDVHATLADALSALRNDLPSALGLHSGPSKSADIGQVVVTGVHGPGRLVAAVVGSGQKGG